jgi:hypothetical protein
MCFVRGCICVDLKNPDSCGIVNRVRVANAGRDYRRMSTVSANHGSQELRGRIATQDTNGYLSDRIWSAGVLSNRASSQNGTGSWKRRSRNCGCSGFSRKFRSPEVTEGTDNTTELLRCSQSSPSWRVASCPDTAGVAHFSGKSRSIRNADDISSGMSADPSTYLSGNVRQVREDLKNCQRPVLAHIDHAVAS